MTERPRAITDDESQYKKALKWFFTANQMGLIDPDSVSMNYETYKTKENAGQYIMHDSANTLYGTTEEEDFVGSANLFAEDMAAYVPAPMATGQGHYFGISSSCENLDKALEFLNWYYSEEGTYILYRGPEGEAWEWDGDHAVYTEAYVENCKTSDPFEFSGGGTLSDATEILNVHPVTYKTEDSRGEYYALGAFNEEQLEGLTTNYLKDDWRAFYGYEDMYEYQKAEGNLTIASPALAFIEVAPDDIKTLESQIGTIVVEASWKCVFAEDEAEFEAIWKQMQEDVEILGMDQIVEDANARFDRAYEIAKSYGMME